MPASERHRDGAGILALQPETTLSACGLGQQLTLR